jgi:hypothetical protein
MPSLVLRASTNRGSVTGVAEADTVVISGLVRSTAGAASLYGDAFTTTISLGGGTTQGAVTIGKSGVDTVFPGTLTLGSSSASLGVGLSWTETVSPFIRQDARTTNALPNVLRMLAQTAWPQAATAANQVGANLILAGGIGSRTLFVSNFALGAGDALQILNDGTTTTLTEGVEFAAVTSNAVTATNIAAAINTSLVATATAISNVVYVTKLATVVHMNIVEVSDAWFATEGVDGAVALPGRGTNSNVIGALATANGDQTVVLGGAALANNTSGIAIGYGATSGTAGIGAFLDSIAIGRNAAAPYTRCISIGLNTTTTSSSGVTIGGNASTGQAAVAVGDTCSAAGQGAVAMGSASSAAGVSSVAIGNTASAVNQYGVAIGDATVTGDFGIAVGRFTSVSHASSVSIGDVVSSSAANQFTTGSLSGPINWFRVVHTNAAATAIRSASTELTALSGSSVTAASLIPAGALVLGVTVRVTTAITGATGFDVGTTTDTSRWGSNIAVALATTTSPTNFTDTSVEWITSVADVILTAQGANFTAGAVRITVHYMTLVAATS